MSAVDFRDYEREAFDAGFSLVPADQNKRPKVKWKQWQEERQTEREYEHLGHGSVWGIVTGALYGIIVLDFDFDAGGEETLEALGLEPTVLTPGGAHVYIQHPGYHVKNSARKFDAYPGLDVRADGGLAWFAGRSKKGVYTPVNWPPHAGELATLDDDLREELLPEVDDATTAAEFDDWTGPGHGVSEATRYVGRLVEDIITAEPGTSNAVLNKAAFAVGGLIAAGQLDGEWAYDRLLEAAEDRGAGDAEVVIAASFEAGEAKPWKFDPMDDEWIPAVTAKALKRGKVPEPTPFPIDVLPAGLDDFVRLGSKSVSCPPDFLGSAVLAAMGHAIGGNISVQLNTRWFESTMLYMTLVGKPSVRKSPALSLALHPMYQASQTLEQQYRDEAAEEGFVEINPPQLFVSDTTMEAMFGVLEASPRGIMMVSDELDGWIKSMGQYKGGGGSDRQHWLSIWSRAPIKVTRKTAGNNFVAKPFVTVLGGIQPDPLEELMNGKNDGLLPRLLMAQGDYVQPRFAPDPVGYDAVLDRYDGTWQDMRDAGAIERVIPLSSSGHARFMQWVNEEHYPTIAQVPEELAAAWGKMDGQCARFALILAMLQGTEVTADIIERAILLVRYFQGQAVAVLQGGGGGSPWEKQFKARTKALSRWLHDNPAATKADIMASGPPWAMDPRALNPVLEALKEMGVGPRG